jgi:alcohol dehydrogenase
LRAVTFDTAAAFVADYPDPKPGDGECLVRVHLAGICATDLQITSGYMNFRGVMGHEMVGTVIAGSPAWRDKRVACEINCVCRKCDMCQRGLSTHCRNRTVMGIDGRDGCFADLVAVPETNLHEIPDVLSDEEAVFVEPLAAAYQVLVQFPVEPRMNVSVVGPGRLGLLVAQVLATTGCKLTAVGRNANKLLLCEKKGIQGIHVDELALRQDRDMVVECTGSPEGLEIAMQLVRPRGTIVLKSTYANPGSVNPAPASSVNLAPASSVNLAPVVVNEVNVVGSRCGPFPEAINALARQAVDVRSMISRTYPIDQALPALEAAKNAENVKILLRLNTN